MPYCGDTFGSMYACDNSVDLSLRISTGCACVVSRSDRGHKPTLMQSYSNDERVVRFRRALSGHCHLTKE